VTNHKKIKLGSSVEAILHKALCMVEMQLFALCIMTLALAIYFTLVVHNLVASLCKLFKLYSLVAFALKQLSALGDEI
jgi:hypothetical protein